MYYGLRDRVNKSDLVLTYLEIIVMMRSGQCFGCIPYLQKPGCKRENTALTHLPGLWVNIAAVAGESTVWRLTHLPVLDEGYLLLNCTFLIFTHFCRSPAFQSRPVMLCPFPGLVHAPLHVLISQRPPVHSGPPFSGLASQAYSWHSCSGSLFRQTIHALSPSWNS